MKIGKLLLLFLANAFALVSPAAANKFSTQSLLLAKQQQDSPSSCQLPPTWAGRWYQTNKEPIRITSTEISDKGSCRDQKGDKYLFELASCLICLVINERHLNVLQYKESSCQPIPANRAQQADHSLLESVCSDITGDAQLESLFRLDTPAIECPISGQYSFTYDNCREPQSSLSSCIDQRQLMFKFSACPDVAGSESKPEVLKCYADWSEGPNHYMIGRLEQASNQQDKGKFRCYIYEKSQDGKVIQMAQSLEESCYGLINANEGPKTLRLSQKPPVQNSCYFPNYINSDSWLSVDNSLIYIFDQNRTKYQVKETREGNIIEEATCLQQYTYPKQITQPPPPTTTTTASTSTTSRRFAPSSSNPSSPSEFFQVYLIQINKNCQTINYCVRFYERSNGIVQIDYMSGQNHCRNALLGTPQTQIITSTNLENQRCPFEGAYTIEAPQETDFTFNPSNIFICPRQSFLTAQCDHPSRLSIHSKCSPAKFFTKNLYCLGSWTTNGMVRLLLADDDRQRYSAWYRDYSHPLHRTQLAGVANSNDNQQQQQETEEASPRAQALQQRQPGAISSRLHPPNAPPAAALHPLAAAAAIVDLQIALITPLPIMTKPMQVRLTRRSQCADLRGYMLGPSSYAGSSPASYVSSGISAASSASTLASISRLNPILLLALLVSRLLMRPAGIAALQRQ